MATFGFAAGEYIKLGPSLYSINVRQGFSGARFTTGADKLVFEVIFCLLTTLGSIPSDPEFGTLLPAAIGKISANDETAIQEFIYNEFSRAQATVIAKQAGQNLPDDQRLTRLMATSVTVDRAKSEAVVTVAISNAAGQTVGVDIPFSAEGT